MQGRRLCGRLYSALLGVVLTLSGCSLKPPWSQEELAAGKSRKLPAEIAKKELTIPRAELVKRLRERGTADGVRLIRTMRGQSYEVEATPEYRIFGVKKGSVFELLGLQNADIILSAESFIIRDPRVFPEYVALLKDQPQASIEIRREGHPLLLAVTIKD